MEIDFKEFNKSVIDDFRANQGVIPGKVVGSELAEAPILLLHTTGAKTGKTRVNPLSYLGDEGRLFIFASYGGAPNHPPWFFNLIAKSSIEVEVGVERFDATASVVDEPQRTALYERMGGIMPMFVGYQSNTERVIPVIELVR